MRSFFAAVVAVFSVAAMASPDWWKGSLTIENHSDYAIHHLYISPSHKSKWGKDWLGTDVLNPDEKVLVSGLNCSDYDIKLVDDEGDSCVVADVDLCQEDAEWELSNRELANCTGFEK